MDVKSALKEARDAIKAKEYNVALKHSMAVLKQDKDNYMALVFTAISRQEVGPSTDVPKYYEKAIAVNKTNILAYQGLASYYEKLNDNKMIGSLVAVYKKILELETNENKILETVRKLALHRETHYRDVVDALYKGVENSNLSDVFKKEACNIVLNLLCANQEVPEEFFKMYEDCFFTIDEDDRKKEFYLMMFEVLYKSKKFELLIKECENMHKQYSSNLKCLEWICNCFIEFYIENSDEYASLMEKAEKSMGILLDMSKENSTALFTKAIFLYNKGEVLETKEILDQVSSNFFNSIYFYLFFTRICIDLHFYNEAIQAALRASELLEKEKKSSAALKHQLDEYILKSFCHSHEEKHLGKVIELYNKISNEDFIDYIIYAYINLKKFEDAENLLSKLDPKTDKYNFFKAKILISKTDCDYALRLLEEHPQETSTYWLTLGDLYWTLEKYPKSLTPYLKAAKLDPNSFICFERLGNFYQKVRDFDKARRCYEKSFKINPNFKSAGIELSKMYRKLQKWDENLNLLLKLTINNKIESENIWAYIQLGIHYLEQKDFNNAINTLRLTVRIQPNDSYCWESLADAYLYRGAYNSALKCYEKSAELMPESLYSKLQIANIKKSIGEYVEAKESFMKILDVDANYVPALKGLAETFFLISKGHKRNQLHGLARNSAQSAIDHVTIALKNTTKMSCLWKICADCCSLVAKLPEIHSFLSINASLAKGTEENDENVGLMQDELYLLAARCYCKSLNCTDNNILIYHDLACCYLSHAKIIEDHEEKDGLLQKALACAQYCTDGNPTYWQHWNLLGNVAFNLQPKNLAIAQHAFVKAVTLEHNSAMAWNNLGALYLHLEDIKLANEAFSQAQRSEPNYTNSWVGQAFIAELVDQDEAMDLFRHTTQLGQHQEGALGYGYWVCKTLLDNPANKDRYSIRNMHAVPVACDALTWYTDHNPYDPCAWNMLGILRERMGLKQGASEAYRNAVKFSRKDAAYVNLGRSFISLGLYEESIKSYEEVNENSFNRNVGLALAYFKHEDYENSYETYKIALDTENQQFQSELLVALASMTYLFQDAETAKNLLFQSTQLEQRSPWSLYATLALGLLEDDSNLAQLALNEIEMLKDDMDCLPHYAILLSYTMLTKGNYNKALSDLSKLVHRHPDQAPLWLSLSILLLRLRQVKPITRASAQCAKAALKLGRTDIDVTQVSCLVSLASLLAGDCNEGLKAIQSAIHCYPNLRQGWTLLKYALSSCN